MRSLRTSTRRRTPDLWACSAGRDLAADEYLVSDQAGKSETRLYFAEFDIEVTGDDARIDKLISMSNVNLRSWSF